MRVAGFTFIKNAIKYDFPIEEAIKSILPLCERIFVAVGKSEDDTRQLIEGISPGKIEILDTEWDLSLREGGRVLAVETDKIFQYIPREYHWAFYIQGDEVFHEEQAETVAAAMQKYKDDPEIDGLLFKYRHFYGSYQYIGANTHWYRREIRVIKNNKNIYSYRDAQGFRKNSNQKLHVAEIDAYIHHYGYVKDPRAMQEKQKTFQKLWHDDETVEKRVAKAEEFDYSGIDALHLYTGTHPVVMKERIKAKNWEFDFDPSFSNMKFKHTFKLFVEKLTGYRPFEYKNYILKEKFEYKK